MLNDRLRRVTDLFIEGTELFFGFESDGKTPILIWVNKLNSFEVEEAGRDGAAARSMRMAELGDDGDEARALRAELATWTDEELAKQRVEQEISEIYLEVMNDLETDPEWRERLDLARRGVELLEDAGAEERDKRRETVAKAQTDYINAIRSKQESAQMDRLAEYQLVSREENERVYIDAWRRYVAGDAFIRERRVTEIYSAMRDCKGSIFGDPGEAEGQHRFDHTDCDHARKSLASRAEVRELPEQVIQRVVDALDGVTVPPREAGNSDAPASSSASLEQSSAAEEASTPSTPLETSPAALTT